MLQDSLRQTTSMVTVGERNRTFKPKRKYVLHVFNICVVDVERSSPRSGLHDDFSKGVSVDHPSGVFVDTGITGMLEARGFNSIDMISPFLEAIVDICCGTGEEAPMTKWFTF